jgi:hypothetical protein
VVKFIQPDITPHLPRLTTFRGSEHSTALPLQSMGQQFNKVIKRKRRAAYLKRKKARVKLAAKKK